MINPDQVTASNSDGISTPDVLRVELSDVNVLNNDVLGSVGHAETLSTNNTLGSNTDDGLVGANVDGADSGLVVCDGDALDTCSSVSVGAPNGS